MDAISALAGSLQRAQVMFNDSAARLASADLPTAVVLEATSPSGPDTSKNVDVAQ